MRLVEINNMEPRLELETGSLHLCISTLDADDAVTVPPGSVEVAFVDTEECSRLHQTFFNDPEITDVMTFPGEPEDDHAGGIAICPVVAKSAGTESGLPFDEELTLYLVHAWLHLAGWRDISPEDRSAMRAEESRLMGVLRRSSAVVEASWMA